jgi:hypothetical protein
MVAALFRLLNIALTASCFLSKCYSENNIFVISDFKHLYNGQLKKYEEMCTEVWLERTVGMEEKIQSQKSVVG